MIGQQIVWLGVRNHGSNDGRYINTPSYHTIKLGGESILAVLQLGAVETLDSDALVSLRFHDVTFKDERGTPRLVHIPGGRVHTVPRSIVYNGVTGITVEYAAYDGRGSATLNIYNWPRVY